MRHGLPRLRSSGFFIFARKRAPARDEIMAQSRAEGSQVLRNVLSFTLRHWGARKALLAGIALSMLFSTLAEVVMPVFAGDLVDALGQGPSAVRASLIAFGVMAALGLLMICLRYSAIVWSSVTVT